MAVIDLTPAVVDIKALGGDTVSFEVRFPPGFVAGRQWKAQVRATLVSEAVDATLVIVPGASEDDPVFVSLTSAMSRALVTEAAMRSLTPAEQRVVDRLPSPYAAGSPLASYKGVWDCQVAPDGGGDPTTTIMKGNVELTLDVTRP